MSIRERVIKDPSTDPERRQVKQEVHPVVEQMEQEWPIMTKEFRRLQRKQY